MPKGYQARIWSNKVVTGNGRGIESRRREGERDNSTLKGQLACVKTAKTVLHCYKLISSQSENF